MESLTRRVVVEAERSEGSLEGPKSALEGALAELRALESVLQRREAEALARCAASETRFHAETARLLAAQEVTLCNNDRKEKKGSLGGNKRMIE